jgi:hypothetical protein
MFLLSALFLFIIESIGLQNTLESSVIRFIKSCENIKLRS